MSFGRPSDEALWRSVERTLRDVVLPEVGDEWARIAAIGLIGLARYGRTRPPDPTEAQVAELAAALDDLVAAGNRMAVQHWPPTDAGPDEASVSRAVSALLAEAVSNPIAAGAAELQATLRPLLVAHLDADLAASMVLMAPFRGQLPDDDAPTGDPTPQAPT